MALTRMACAASSLPGAIIPGHVGPLTTGMPSQHTSLLVGTCFGPKHHHLSV